MIGELMKKLKLSEYRSSMGVLIDLSNNGYFNNYTSLNIPYNKLMLYYQKYLDKNKKYYFICRNGVHSKMASKLLNYLGYNTTYLEI